MTASPRPRLDRPRPTPAGRPLQPDLHPPKVENFDLAARVNVDPKGIRDRLDHYELITPELLYMRRGMDIPVSAICKPICLPTSASAPISTTIAPRSPRRGYRTCSLPGHCCDPPRRPAALGGARFYLDLVARPKTAAVLPTVAGLAQTPPATPAHVEVEDIDELLAATAADLILP